MDKKLAVIIHLMPWELDLFIELTNQLKRNSTFIDSSNIIFDITLTISDDQIDWENSEKNVCKDYTLKKFHEILKKYDWGCEVKTHIIESGSYGCVSARRDATERYGDEYIMWLDPDIVFSDLTFSVIIQTINHLKSDLFLITPQVVKNGDHTWDVITNEQFVNEPYGFHKTFDPYGINKFTMENMSDLVVNINPKIKFGGGWCNTFSGKLLKMLEIPKDVPAYGIEDYYTQEGIKCLKSLGVDVNQYVVQNLIVAENHKYWNLTEMNKECYKLKLTKEKQRDITDKISAQVFNELFERLQNEHGIGQNVSPHIQSLMGEEK